MFQNDGYETHSSVLAPAKFEALAAHFEAKLAALPAGRRPEHMDVPHLTDPALFEWLLDADVLDLVESLIGPDIALFSSHFICKPAGDGKPVPWHQDAHFWRDTIDPAGDAITVWLAIDPSTVENGCLRVIPGSHLAAVSHHGTDDWFFNQETSVDESLAVDVELERGACSIHSAMLVHGSPPNHSTKRRCGYTMRYVPTTVRFLKAGDHRIYLARGRDHAGNVYAPVP
ncbi:phytanoyl-CoA dioxygenase family protein [Lentzea flava]|uniref:Syringomycin biosynthesis enzyme n=1 Tax=Lentzea flava TaxID=103732 RepID=A0ABQ2UDE4_9PSEU|nr:phytanoyl-CoA dioxygenase family protein [Lentzea flava]MCP2197875.1 Phytanoyl-CoA dioxygenase (PhyH) [Lentzea flava]GGU23066.1 syringomycin biosynthesis enzyme [Lentzea flava]